MAWVVVGAERAFATWLDVDTTVDPSLAVYIEQWVVEFAEKGPDRSDGAITYDDGERVAYRPQLTKVEVNCLFDREQGLIFIRSIGRPSSRLRYP